MGTNFYARIIPKEEDKQKLIDAINNNQYDIIENLEVSGANAVYDMKKAEGKDPYEFFLSGNQPLVKIRNPKNADAEKLIVFRDSFASSIMPLLAQGFSEVTMIDLRYIIIIILTLSPHKRRESIN